LTRTVPVSLATLALLGVAGAGQASSAAPAAPTAWATVNVCDASSVGMRVGVLGDGRDRRVHARFIAQWWSPVSKGWVPVAGSSSSPWVEVGSTRFVSRQNGWTFAFAPTAPGTHDVVRGLATLQWRAGGKVVAQRTLVTRAGLAGVDGGDPAGTSRASCTLG
jgi:hypothetical protein